MSSLNEFVAFVLSKRSVIPDYTIKMIEFIRKSHESTKDIKLNKSSIEALTSTPDEIMSLCAYAKTYGDYCNAFLSSSIKFKALFNRPSKEELIADFAAIKADLEEENRDIAYDSYAQGFSFKKTIIMNDVYRDIKFDFGSFIIVFGPTYVEMHPNKNNTMRNDQLHPYIVRGSRKVCLGTYSEPYKLAMASLRYHAAYILVMQCITQYGGDMLNGSAAGPQNALELWVGQICSICDGQVKTEEISVCGKTNRAICPSCVDTGMCTDEIDGEVYHSDVIKLCKTCNKKTSTVIRSKCLSCRQKALASV